MNYDGLPPTDFAPLLGVPTVLTLPRVTSTLDVVHRLAEADAPTGTVVIADEQLEGRGRFGRIWHSPPGLGIWMGFLVRPSVGLGPGVLSLRVGLAVASALDDVAVSVQLKWPNDIILTDRKLGGILCEARWLRDRLRWISVGIGLNVHGPMPREVEFGGVTLDTARPGVSRVDVLERLVPRLHAMSHSPILEDREMAEYDRRDWLAGRILREPVAGKVEGISREGALIVRVNGRVERVIGGTVVTA